MDLVVSEVMEEDSGAEEEEVLILPAMEGMMCLLVNGDAESDFLMVLLCEVAMDMEGEGAEADGRRRKSIYDLP